MASIPSIGFSGAGFLGCYHVGVAAALEKHGWIGYTNYDRNTMQNNMQQTPSSAPLLTGVSAGSMMAASIHAGVSPEPDGMEVVLTAARRTRELPISILDALTPGYSLIDAVEGPFRMAIVKAMGGTLPSKQPRSSDDYSLDSLYDVDPDLFRRRFPTGSLRIGLTDKRALLSSFPPSSPLSSLPAAYRYVDSYRNVEDIVASCMLSSYIPGVTGPLMKDNIAEKLLGTLYNIAQSEKDKENVVKASANDAMIRASRQLHEMKRLGMVKDGRTHARIEPEHDTEEQETTHYWDGGIADVFPTFDDGTIIVSLINGIYKNPAICPSLQEQHNEKEEGSQSLKSESLSYLIRSYIPTLPATFRHCSKSHLGLNVENARAVKAMLLSSDDEQLYLRFRDGYDDATRFLSDRDLLRVFKG